MACESDQTDEPTSRELFQIATRVAVMEEKMNTQQAKFDAMIERFHSTIERFQKESAQRDKDNLRWMIGFWIGAIVVIGIIVRWPA